MTESRRMALGGELTESKRMALGSKAYMLGPGRELAPESRQMKFKSVHQSVEKIPSSKMYNLDPYNSRMDRNHNYENNHTQGERLKSTRRQLMPIRSEGPLKEMVIQ